jgi:hypothetical protein
MMNQPTFAPKINKNVVVDMGPGNVVERAMAWEASKERKRVNQIHEQRIKESLQATHTPIINRRSELLVAGTRTEDVASHLYKLAPALRVQREEMQEQQLLDSVPGNPAITRMAAGLRREGPVGERLYANAVEQQRRHRERIAQAEQERVERAKAAAEYSHSKAQGAMRKMTNDGDVPQGHSLYNRAQNTLRKKDKQRQLESKAQQAKARPRLSKRSLKLAADLGNPKERLTKLRPTQVRELQMLAIKREINMFEQENVGSRTQSHHADSHKGHLPSDTMDPELTFSPQVNPISERIASMKNSRKNLYPGEEKIDFGDRLHRDHKTWHKGLDALRQEKLDKELAECTFTPDREKSKRTYERIGVGTVSYGDKGSERPEQRLNKWLRKRDQKIERKMKEMHDSKVSGCTFQPNLARRTGGGGAGTNKVRAGTGVPSNAGRRVAWNKQRRATQQFNMLQKLSNNDYNIIHSPYMEKGGGAADGEAKGGGALSPNGEEEERRLRKESVARRKRETEEEARQRRREESERKHMIRMKKAHESRRHQRASVILNQFRDPYTVSGNTNPDLKSIGAAVGEDTTTMGLVVASEPGTGEGDGGERSYGNVLRRPVSPGAIDIHETF